MHFTSTHGILHVFVMFKMSPSCSKFILLNDTWIKINAGPAKYTLHDCILYILHSISMNIYIRFTKFIKYLKSCQNKIHLINFYLNLYTKSVQSKKILVNYNLIRQVLLTNFPSFQQFIASNILNKIG